MKYWFDERGHLHNNTGVPEISDDEICHRLEVYDSLGERVVDIQSRAARIETRLMRLAELLNVDVRQGGKHETPT